MTNVKMSYSAIQCVLFQFLVPSRFFKLIQQLLTYPSSSSRQLYPSLHLSFNNVLQKAMSTQDVTNPVSPLSFTVGRIFLTSLNLSNTTSFLTRSVKLSFFILLHPRKSKFSRYFCSTSRSVQVLALTKVMLQIQQFTRFSLNSSPIFWWKKVFFLLNIVFQANPGFNFTCTSGVIGYHATTLDEILHIPRLIKMSWSDTNVPNTHRIKNTIKIE